MAGYAPIPMVETLTMFSQLLDNGLKLVPAYRLE